MVNTDEGKEPLISSNKMPPHRLTRTLQLTSPKPSPFVELEVKRSRRNDTKDLSEYWNRYNRKGLGFFYPQIVRRNYGIKEKIMDEENKQITIMECSASYSLSDETGQLTAKGDAQVKLEEENISLLPKFGEALFFSLRDILEIIEDDYKIHLILTSKEKLTIFNLGYKYEDFLRVLSRLRNEILLKDMLMHETLRKSGVEAEFIHYDENGNEKKRGKCEPRLYETGIVVIPEKGELVRIPYSDIWEIQAEDFNLTVTTDFGEKFVFSKMEDNLTRSQKHYLT